MVFSQLMILSDALQLLRHIWHLFQTLTPTDDLVLYQQDIAGFFNFVTHPRVTSAIEYLVLRYAALQGLDLRDDPTIGPVVHRVWFAARREHSTRAQAHW